MGPADEQFVGREEELAALEQAWAAVVRGHPQLVLVSGDAGIGKSALVARFLDARPDARVLRGGCFGLVSAQLPYSPVVQALRPLGEVDPGELGPGIDGATLRAVLGGRAEAVEEATRWAQIRLFEGTLRLFRELSRQRPLVIALEDLHWVDQATLDLLLFVLGNLVNERILVLLTVRSDEPGGQPWLAEGLQRLTRLDAARVVELGPLPADHATTLAAEVCGPGCDADAVRHVVGRAEGNPLFLRELAGARGSGPQAVPRRLRDLLLLRTARLSPDGRQAVNLLSAATAPVDAQLLHRALEDDVADPRLSVAEAFEAQLLDSDGEFGVRLRHALVGEAVYASLPPPERLHCHARLAAAVADTAEAGDERWALAAYHWEHAGRLDRVPDPLARAARLAGRSFAFADAARAWERLLAVDARTPGACATAGLDRADVLVEAARVHRWGASPQRAVEALQEALVLLAGDGARAALAREQLARQLLDLGRVDDALAAIGRAALEAAGADARTRARVESTHGAVLMFRGEYEGSRQRCAAALDLLPGDDATWERAHACTVLGVDLVNLGDIDGALTALDAAVSVATRLDDPEPLLRTYVNQVYVLEAAGRFADAVRVADDGLAYAERQDMQAVAGSLLLGNQASALIASGDLLRARAQLCRAVDQPGPRGSLLYAQLRLAEVEVALGELDGAAVRLARVPPDELASDSVAETQFRLVQAALGLAGDRPEAAVEAARAELARSDGGTEPVVGLQLFAVGLRALSLTAARGAGTDIADVTADLIKAAGSLRDQAPLPPCQDLYDLCALEYRSCSGEVDPEAWDELAERLSTAGHGAYAPYCWYRAATASLARDGRRAAWPALRSAWRTLEPLPGGALRREVGALAATCRLDLAEGPAPARPAGSGAPTPLFGLTPRELQVLECVCSGATNRQISRELKISERTAGVHVSHILTKLQVRNRAEAIAIAHRTGAVRTLT